MASVSRLPAAIASETNYSSIKAALLHACAATEGKTTMQSDPLCVSPPFAPAEPLWQRVPTRGDDGHPLSDFMIIIPGLREWPKERRQQAVGKLQGVFEHYRHAVVFADLNLRLNLLWVSVRPIPGICIELPAAIKFQVPEAKLVANKAEAMMSLRLGSVTPGIPTPGADRPSPCPPGSADR